MTEEIKEETNTTEKSNDKEYNFRALEAKYKKELEKERAERERLIKEYEERYNTPDEDEDDSDPYIDKKRLKQTLAKTKQETKADINQTVQQALYEERKQMWLDQNSDFYDVMEKNAAKLMEKAPEIAKTILNLPDNFERAKLVYHNIKALGLDQPERKDPSIEEKIQANRKSPYYQPSGVGTAPYGPQGDYSPEGKKRAYEEVQKLKANLRLG